MAFAPPQKRWNSAKLNLKLLEMYNKSKFSLSFKFSLKAPPNANNNDALIRIKNIKCCFKNHWI